jgi:hypothetical protein
MSDEYQRGTDQEWLEHSNQELSRMLKKRDRALALHRLLLVLLLAATAIMGAALHKINQTHPIRDLLGF